MNHENIVFDIKGSCFTNLVQFHEEDLMDGGTHVDNNNTQKNHVGMSNGVHVQQMLKDPRVGKNKKVITKPNGHKQPSGRQTWKVKKQSTSHVIIVSHEIKPSTILKKIGTWLTIKKMTLKVIKRNLLLVNKEFACVNYEDIVSNVKNSCYVYLEQFYKETLTDERAYDNSGAQ